MRINATHSLDERGLDPYWTPPEATRALLAVENVPKNVWEPACGAGNIAEVLRGAGHDVLASDIKDYGYPGTHVEDFLASSCSEANAIVTNPPYRLAEAFAKHAIAEVSYVAFLLRLNFLESTRRLAFFREYPPSRVWVSSRRLPMMHRLGWTGPEAPSNHCFAWFIWSNWTKKQHQSEIRWFDWKDYSAGVPGR
ncbi:MAG: hypothetical protein C4555_05155 [Dehalococcoidia bacterium]|nr:MAG: hypothetical protein C4555_05155 [Dehalococcoidia bacterium]